MVKELPSELSIVSKLFFKEFPGASFITVKTINRWFTFWTSRSFFLPINSLKTILSEVPTGASFLSIKSVKTLLLELPELLSNSQEPQNSSLRTLWRFFHFFQNGWEANYCSRDLKREGKALEDIDVEPLDERVGAVGG